MKNVLIPTKLDSIAREDLEENGFHVVQDAAADLEDLIRAHPETQALIVRSNKITADVIDALPKLRLIVRAGSGYNTIDIKHARKNGVDVMNTPGANSNAVAEEVVAMVLAHYRHIVRGDNSVREGLWEKKQLMGRELAGKTIGIVGLGNIGQLVVKRLAGFDVTCLGYDPLISEALANEMDVRLVDLERLFAESDVITLHIPENDETRGMVNRQLLEKMKPDALLVNCARAGILNEDDFRAVKAEKNIALCNDVYSADKPGDKSVSDIADLMLPHLGASTREANRNAALRAAEQLIAYAERGVTRYVVNKAVPDGLDEQYQELAFQIARVARHCVGLDCSVNRVECSFYGELQQFAEWLLPPVVAGISSEFDPLEGLDEARGFLQERGITLHVRETDERKQYGNSMTCDLISEDDVMQHVSIRGTIAEGNLVISRINEFDKLYVATKGHTLVVSYVDRPGVLASITGACAKADINIDDIRCPHDKSGRKSVAVLKTNRAVPADVVDRIKSETDCEIVFAISLS